MRGKAFHLPRPRLEGVAVIVISIVATAYAEWGIISDPYAFQPDAFIHEWWMRRFRDPDLFRDPLTSGFVGAGYVPLGVQLFYRAGSLLVDPIALAESMPLVLAPLSVWMLFRIVRFHSSWKPAAWIGAGLFLVPWDTLRFSGGHSRAFVQPIILATVLLAITKRDRLAGAIPPLGFLFYPQAALVAFGILSVTALEHLRPFRIDKRRAVVVVASGLLMVGAYFVPRIAMDHHPELITEEQARALPEFSPAGPAHYFQDDLTSSLSQNYSGFRLQRSGSILAVACLIAMILRPRVLATLRKEVIAMPLVALTLFGIAHATLFALYVPQRYTYALLPFFCIVIALSLGPLLDALRRRTGWWAIPLGILSASAAVAVALMLFPLGPRIAGADLVGSVPASPLLPILAGALLVAIGVLMVLARSTSPESRSGLIAAGATVLTGGVLVGQIAAFAGPSTVARCEPPALFEFLRTVPKDAIVAGDPIRINCVPIAGRRPVMISRKTYQPWETGYLPIARERMFALTRAYFGGSIGEILELRSEYGVDLLVVRSSRDRAWRKLAPFTELREQLLGTVERRAVEHLPEVCLTFRIEDAQVYDLGCVEDVRTASARVSGRGLASHRPVVHEHLEATHPVAASEIAVAQ